MVRASQSTYSSCVQPRMSGEVAMTVLLDANSYVAQGELMAWTSRRRDDYEEPRRKPIGQAPANPSHPSPESCTITR